MRPWERWSIPRRPPLNGWRDPVGHRRGSPSPATGHPPAATDLGRLVILVAAGVLPLLLVLWLTRSQAPLRSAAGIYFGLVLVPGLQLLLGAFFGPRVALAAGLLFATLTAWQVIGPARPVEMQPIHWYTGFGAPSQELRAGLAPPPSSQAQRLLTRGGAATLFVCLSKGSGDDLEVRFEGEPLSSILRRPTAGDCWLQLEVPADRLPPPGRAAEVRLRLREGSAEEVTGGNAEVVLIGGYTRPRTQGGRSGGAAFFDGSAWQADDLSPIEIGPQGGRYFVELRITDAGGQIREVWY
jgi:hypothetical protein